MFLLSIITIHIDLYPNLYYNKSINSLQLAQYTTPVFKTWVSEWLSVQYIIYSC